MSIVGGGIQVREIGGMLPMWHPASDLSTMGFGQEAQVCAAAPGDVPISLPFPCGGSGDLSDYGLQGRVSMLRESDRSNFTRGESWGIVVARL